MSILNKNLGFLLIGIMAFSLSNMSHANKVSFYVGFSQPQVVQQPYYAPVAMQPMYVTHKFKQCYIQNPMYVNGVFYPAQRICEHRYAPIPETGADYYQIHRHHVSYKYYY